MPTNTGRKRASVKASSEDFYKILNVRKNARPETIKQSYIQLVKQYPPETHSEEFQQIRKAYETLRDPVKRGQYDILRKYGDNLGDLMEQAMKLADAQKWKEAAKLLNQVIAMAPRYPGGYVLLAQIFLAQSQFEQFEATMERAYQSVDNDEERLSVLLFKADLLIEVELSDWALDVLDEVEDNFPDQAHEIEPARIEALLDLDRAEEAYKLATARIPAPEFDDVELFGEFLRWINVVMYGDLWKYWATVKTRARKFLRSVTDDEDQRMVVDAFLGEAEEWEKSGNYKAALAYVMLSLDVTPKDPELLEWRRRIEQLQRLQVEMTRLAADFSLFPFVGWQALLWHRAAQVGEAGFAEIAEETSDPESQELLDEMAEQHEEIARGILHLKKKYPLVYRQYQEQWEALFDEHTSGLNREARRRLR